MSARASLPLQFAGSYLNRWSLERLLTAIKFKNRQYFKNRKLSLRFFLFSYLYHSVIILNMHNASKDTEKKEIETKITEIEKQMNAPDFWNDKEKAQLKVKEYQDLKSALGGKEKYDRGNAVITIFSGAGGDDSEDFSAILFSMYRRYSEKRGWQTLLLHENQNEHGGYRNVTFEIVGKGSYGDLRNESGVHRLVRISPFNARKQRHTSFSLVEVVPVFEDMGAIKLDDKDLDISYTKSSGPGGQNVNKRETAVRIVHTPTNISVHIDSERSQAQNKEKALSLLKGKIHKAIEEDKIKEEKGHYISKTTSVEWGNQIRSYVFHPYKMVKDHRTEVETSDVDSVLQGDIDAFVEEEKKL